MRETLQACCLIGLIFALPAAAHGIAAEASVNHAADGYAVTSRPVA